MKEENVVRVSSPGLSFAPLLAILFIGLKLTGNIAWSWVWVLSPLWISAALVLAITTIVFLVILLRAVFMSMR